MHNNPFYAYAVDRRNKNYDCLLLIFASRVVADKWWRSVSQGNTFQRITPQFYVYDRSYEGISSFFSSNEHLSNEFAHQMIIQKVNNASDQGTGTVLPSMSITDHISGNWYYIRSTLDPDMYWSYFGPDRITLSCDVAHRTAFRVKALEEPGGTVLIDEDKVLISVAPNVHLGVGNEGRLSTSEHPHLFTFEDFGQGQFLASALSLDLEYKPDALVQGGIWELVNSYTTPSKPSGASKSPQIDKVLAMQHEGNREGPELCLFSELPHQSQVGGHQASYTVNHNGDALLSSSKKVEELCTQLLHVFSDDYERGSPKCTPSIDSQGSKQLQVSHSFASGIASDEQDESGLSSSVAIGSRSSDSSAHCWSLVLQSSSRLLESLSHDEEPIEETAPHDPYGDWQRQVYEDAFEAARQEHSDAQSLFLSAQEQRRIKEAERRDKMFQDQMADVQKHLDELSLQQAKENEGLKAGWKAQDVRISQRIERVIRHEEEVNRRAAPKKLVEAGERMQRESEGAENQAERERNRRNEELLRTKEKAKAKQLQLEQEARKLTGFSTSDDEWKSAMRTLRALKDGPMKRIKSMPNTKRILDAARRQIIPKVGELTSDNASVHRVKSQLVEIVKPSPPYPEVLYHVMLSHLAKAILLQAEVEVTARRNSALPLAELTLLLLSELDHFPDIFFARMAQRAGPWVMPITVSLQDYNNDQDAWCTAIGYHNSKKGGEQETALDYSIRPLDFKLDARFCTARYWTWFARLCNETGMLQNEVAASLIHTGLEVFGASAKSIWGLQWIKLLELLYAGVTTGMDKGIYIGGATREGKSARARVELEIQRILS